MKQQYPPVDLYHVREDSLAVGECIQPGRWGEKLRAHGEEHPSFCREQLLESWRSCRTSVAVSRLRCAFAFDGLQQARNYSKPGEIVHRVRLIEPNTPNFRADMLWLTWMNEPGVPQSSLEEWCAGYWAGRATNEVSPLAQPAWEWLLDCPLEVLEIMPSAPSCRVGNSLPT